jgi:hypothetical protein
MAVTIELRIVRKMGSRRVRERSLLARSVAILNSRIPAEVELEHAGDHDHGLRPVPVLEHREFEGLRAVNEQATAKAFLGLNDPVASAVLSDHEQ